MILKGNIRGKGSDLAAHLLNAQGNDSVELGDLRGFASQDLAGAIAEIEAIASATKGQKPLYSLSINPEQPMTREQYEHAVETIGNALGLADQPRATVYHVKDGREHAHVVWSRVDTDKMQIINHSHDRQQLRECAKTLAREFGHELPEGLANDRGADRFKDRFNDSSLAEHAQAERGGMSKAERIEFITAAYRQSDDAKAFYNALDEGGFILARGDKRGFVAVDIQGDIHSLGRCIQGETTKSIQANLNLDDRAALPSVQQAKEIHATRLREKAAEKARDTFDAHKRADMAEAHLKAVQDAHIAEMKAMKGEHSDQLKEMSKDEADRINDARKAVQDAYKPEWAQLFKAQRAEMEEIKDHLKNPVSRLKWMLDNPNYDLIDPVNRGHLSKAFQFIVMGKADLSKIEERQKRERIELSQAQKAATRGEISEIKTDTKIKRREATHDHRETMAAREKDYEREMSAAERDLNRAKETAEKTAAPRTQETQRERSTREQQGFGNIGFGRQGFGKERDEREDDERERFIKPPGQSFQP